MKKTISNIFMMAALLMAGMVVVSCEKENTPVSGKFIMTIDASKANFGGAKDLNLDGTTLNASWKAGEKVQVYNEDNIHLGELVADENGDNTTLSGSLDGRYIEEGKDLTLKFCVNHNYASQDGTLADIAANHDYAVATVTVNQIITEGGDKVIKTSGHAIFYSQQAIVKFTLLDKGDNNAPINPTTMTVYDGTTNLNLTIPADTYTTNGDGVIFVAFPATGNQTELNVQARIGEGNPYSYTRTIEQGGITLVNGNYYEITVKMNN